MEAIVKDKRTIVLSEEAARELNLEPGTRLVVRKEARRLILEDRKQLLRAVLERARDLRRKA